LLRLEALRDRLASGDAWLTPHIPKWMHLPEQVE
jgi:hypothetical protein